MSTLTLTFDDDLAAQAREYARRTGTDLSGLVAELLRPVVAAPTAQAKALPPELAALHGCISLPPDYKYKAHLDEVFNDHHRP